MIMNSKTTSTRNKLKKCNNSTKDFVKVYKALKKLEGAFLADHNMMLQCSEYLIKENTLSSSPNPSNICNWVLRWTDILITTTDARGLLTYVSLQLAKHHNLQHCALLPPARSDYEKWCRTLKDIAQQTSGGNGYREDDGDVAVYAVDQHKLQRHPRGDKRGNRQQQQQQGLNGRGQDREREQNPRLAKMREAEDPTLHMFPSLTPAQQGQTQQQSSAAALPPPKSILKIKSGHNYCGGGDGTEVGAGTNELLSPIKFKKTSTSMTYKKYGSCRELEGNVQLSVSDMVALARKKQHYERLHRLEGEMAFGRNSIDYGLASKPNAMVKKDLPQLKPVAYNNQIDTQLFGEKTGLHQSSSHIGMKGSPHTKMVKAKPKFRKESARVTDEVYTVLGVRSDKTVRPRKY
jgi:hypothetical protein